MTSLLKWLRKWLLHKALQPDFQGGCFFLIPILFASSTQGAFHDPRQASP
jgi:hypothetical protein